MIICYIWSSVSYIIYKCLMLLIYMTTLKSPTQNRLVHSVYISKHVWLKFCSNVNGSIMSILLEWVPLNKK